MIEKRAPLINENEINAELRQLFLGGDDWNKEACMGYFLKACQSTDLDHVMIQNLALNLYRLFAALSIHEAKNVYYNECHDILTGHK